MEARRNESEQWGDWVIPLAIGFVLVALYIYFQGAWQGPR